LLPALQPHFYSCYNFKWGCLGANANVSALHFLGVIQKRRVKGHLGFSRIQVTCCTIFLIHMKVFHIFGNGGCKSGVTKESKQNECYSTRITKHT
jgi:hypothetical protein